jgi:hypothetical protein
MAPEKIHQTDTLSCAVAARGVGAGGACLIDGVKQVCLIISASSEKNL